MDEFCSSDAVLADILEVTHIAVMLRRSEFCYRGLTRFPDWLTQIGSCSEERVILFDQPGFYMQNFLVDANQFWSTATQGSIHSGKWLQTDSAGKEHVFEATATYLQRQPVLLVQRVTDAYYELQSVLQIARDTAAEKNKLERLVYFDELTGLYNRRGFTTFAEKQLLMTKRSAASVLMLSVDMDRLKSINDTYGHAAGDRAIIAVAHILRAVFRETDIIGRLGGDEFVVLVVNAGDQHAESITKRLVQATEARNKQSGQNFLLSISFGAAVFNGTGDASLEALLTESDANMYQHKRSKRAV